MFQYILEILAVVAVSATKNFMGISLAVYYTFGFWLSLLLTVGGGMIGAYIFTYFGEWFVKYISRWYNVEKKIDHLRTKNKFTKYLISGYGLTAVAALTPVLLSVPLGSFMAVTMEKNRRRILLFMFVAFLFWSAFINGTSYLLGLNPQQWLKDFWLTWQEL